MRTSERRAASHEAAPCGRFGQRGSRAAGSEHEDSGTCECRVLTARGTYPKWRCQPHEECPMSNNEEPVTNNSKTCTDLPLLPGGNNGSEVGPPDVEAGTDIARLLSEMFE